MSGRERDRDIDELELTAQPKSMPEELAGSVVQESGLSVDPEDLGRQFLSEATEQHNYESARGGDSAELSVTEGAPSDEALSGPNFESDRSMWENTVSVSMERGGVDAARGEIAPSAPDDDGLQFLDEESDIDLTEPVIHEASLLDHEADELGETEAPRVQTDDSHTHGKKRGGHSPKAMHSIHRTR